MPEMRAFWVGFGVAVAIGLTIWMLVGLARSFKDDLDQQFKRLWDVSLRTSETGSMLAGRICEMNERVEALEKAVQAKEAMVK
jgi:hypothetical protein